MCTSIHKVSWPHTFFTAQYIFCSAGLVPGVMPYTHETMFYILIRLQKEAGTDITTSRLSCAPVM